MGEEGDQFQRWRQIMLLSAIPMVLVAGPLVGFFVGDFLDRKMGTAPWLMILFLILGAFSSVKQVLRLLAKAMGPLK
ncbi:MAG TPA: AtpZ/AtpI family protein [Candidatus Manganitrophaceae bacterium]